MTYEELRELNDSMYVHVSLAEYQSFMKALKLLHESNWQKGTLSINDAYSLYQKDAINAREYNDILAVMDIHDDLMEEGAREEW